MNTYCRERELDGPSMRFGCFTRMYHAQTMSIKRVPIVSVRFMAVLKQCWDHFQTIAQLYQHDHKTNHPYTLLLMV